MGVSALCGALWGLLAAPARGNVCPPGRTYTLNPDFDEGTLINVNHDVPNQLQLNEDTEPFPFVWIAASNRGTAVKIDTKSGAILGEYRTAPDSISSQNPPGTAFPNPSRTTVDLRGSAWVANRNDIDNCGGLDKGSVARIGLIIGGTRVNADSTLNPLGDYVAGPSYSTCVDRDGDGLIKTSRGLGDVRPWPDAANADLCGGVTTADDECIINYTRVIGTGTRTIAIDANNDVWTGGLNNQAHEKLDGVTGQPIGGTQFDLNCGGYGGLIDPFGILWSARSLLRYNPSTATGACLGNDPGNYGLGLDPTTCRVWGSDLGGTNEVHEFNFDGTTRNTYSQASLTNGGAQGIAVDGNSHVWVAEIFGDQVLHLAPDTLNNFPGDHCIVGTVMGLAGTTGVAVDSNGKIWASEINSSGTRGAARINPSLGPLGTPGCGAAGGLPVGMIDLTVGLDGPGQTVAAPYNYSDMTGRVGLRGANSGTWNVIRDGNKEGTEWGTVTWNTEDCADPHEPPGTSLTVRIRAADTQGGLGAETFIEVGNGVKFTGVFGRFMEIEVTFSGMAGCEFVTPVLCDLSVEPQCPGDEDIPTVSEWGLLVLALLLLTGGKVYYTHSCRPTMAA